MKRLIFDGIFIVVAIGVLSIFVLGKRAEPIPEEIIICANTTPLRQFIHEFDHFLQQNFDSSQTSLVLAHNFLCFSHPDLHCSDDILRVMVKNKFNP